MNKKIFSPYGIIIILIIIVIAFVIIFIYSNPKIKSVIENQINNTKQSNNQTAQSLPQYYISGQMSQINNNIINLKNCNLSKALKSDNSSSAFTDQCQTQINEKTQFIILDFTNKSGPANKSGALSDININDNISAYSDQNINNVEEILMASIVQIIKIPVSGQ